MPVLMTKDQIAELVACACLLCQKGKEHKHSFETGWYGITHLLLVPESLDPKDSIPLEACDLCGHKRAKKD